MRRIGWKRKTEVPGRLTGLSAWALLQAQQEALLMTASDRGFGLCLNACVAARALRRRGRAVFPDGETALRQLTEPQLRTLIETYLERFGQTPALPAAEAVNPQFDEARFEELRGA